MEESADVHYEIGLCHLKLANIAKGESFMLKAIELNPRVKYGEAYLRLGEALAPASPERAAQVHRTIPRPALFIGRSLLPSWPAVSAARPRRKTPSALTAKRWIFTAACRATAADSSGAGHGWRASNKRRFRSMWRNLFSCAHTAMHEQPRAKQPDENRRDRVQIVQPEAAPGSGAMRSQSVSSAGCTR